MSTEREELLAFINALKESFQYQINGISDRIKEINNILNVSSREITTISANINNLKEDIEKIELIVTALSQIETKMSYMKDDMDYFSKNLSNYIETCNNKKEIYIDTLSKLTMKIDNLEKKYSSLPLFNKENSEEINIKLKPSKLNFSNLSTILLFFIIGLMTIVGYIAQNNILEKIQVGL